MLTLLRQMAVLCGVALFFNRWSLAKWRSLHLRTLQPDDYTVWVQGLPAAADSAAVAALQARRPRPLCTLLHRAHPCSTRPCPCYTPLQCSVASPRTLAPKPKCCA